MLQQYHQILVAVDGSYESELAFKKAVSIALRNQASLHLVHVIDTRSFQNISSFDTSMVEQVTKTAKETLDKYLQEAKEAGLDSVNYSIEYGSPKTIISKDMPTDLKIDLIIIGATGLNAVERILIGSVTEYVTRSAACDVLVVRTDLNNNYIKNNNNNDK
ncbi:universal stress protein [Lentilactobacillus laojiaonis]|uniref:universal stress protein n=1 Tax=Lentilactobacillus laojiaonis TaxID=2883998 RepID=UPI001D0A090D|nr:universal stress protein [Lentilactobacillus laojiaonis]UDM31741.1 universal stress protein [Lentilactobacillus laojiaonis]